MKKCNYTDSATHATWGPPLSAAPFIQQSCLLCRRGLPPSPNCDMHPCEIACSLSSSHVSWWHKHPLALDVPAELISRSLHTLHVALHIVDESKYYQSLFME